jgi:ribose 5-phosphate isomerase B
MTLKIAIAADHGGFDLKEDIKKFVFTDLNIEWIDLGTHSNESVDYPEYGFKISQALENDRVNTGVIICGSGIGISIAANRNSHIRAALCTSTEMAKLSREHNNANVLALGARITDRDNVMKIVQTFLTTEFEGGRHARRVEKLSGGCSHAE